MECHRVWTFDAEKVRANAETIAQPTAQGVLYEIPPLKSKERKAKMGLPSPAKAPSGQRKDGRPLCPGPGSVLMLEYSRMYGIVEHKQRRVCLQRRRRQ